MLSIFLQNLWTMTLIIGCITIIVVLLGIIFATISAIIEIKQKK